MVTEKGDIGRSRKKNCRIMLGKVPGGQVDPALRVFL